MYEPVPIEDPLDLLPDKITALKKKANHSKDERNRKLIKDKVPMAVAANKKKGRFPKSLYGKEDQYEVVGGDTLMLIAFKLFGDFNYWKELAKWNRDFLGKNYDINIGMNLKFFNLKTKNLWPPSGNPYMIKKGDFLTKISEKIYGTSKKWRKIFKRNKLMVKNPDLIFAGFTLFYDSKALKH